MIIPRTHTNIITVETTRDLVLRDFDSMQKNGWRVIRVRGFDDRLGRIFITAIFSGGVDA